jgi:hypothetical protein
MVKSIRVNLRMISAKAKEYSHGVTEEYMRVRGKTESSMGKAFL